jgi:hypothetical protein
MELSNEDVMLLAGGRIRCRRCSARSKRTKLRCSAPATKVKRVCSTHGGKSIGPLTEQGKAKGYRPITSFDGVRRMLLDKKPD